MTTYGLVADLKAIVAAGEPIAVDIETDGAEVDRCRITCLSFANTSRGVSFLPEGPAWDYAKEVLANPSITKIFHNGFFFDVPVLRRHGVEVL